METLFKGRIGSSYDVDKEHEIYKLGEYRYRNQIPPGYADEKDKPEIWRKYGDLVLWLQTIDHASLEETKSIIFVTNDAKEDWITKGGHPNPLLIEEFVKRTSGKKSWLMNLESFLEEAIKRKVIRDNRSAKEVVLEAGKDAEEYKQHDMPYVPSDAIEALKRIGEIISSSQQTLIRDSIKAIQGPIDYKDYIISPVLEIQKPLSYDASIASLAQMARLSSIHQALSGLPSLPITRRPIEEASRDVDNDSEKEESS